MLREALVRRKSFVLLLKTIWFEIIEYSKKIRHNLMIKDQVSLEEFSDRRSGGGLSE